MNKMIQQLTDRQHLRDDNIHMVKTGQLSNMMGQRNRRTLGFHRRIILD
jgi:hypothetical protein